MNIIDKIFKHEIDSKIFRKALVQYPYLNNTSHEYICNITSVKAFQLKNKIKVEIRTHRPGILIGMKGNQINGIKEYMNRKCGQEVEIFLIEEDLFQHLYD